MEAICFSEKLVDTQRTTRRYIPEDGTLHKLILFRRRSWVQKFVTIKMDVLLYIQAITSLVLENDLGALHH
jgi:hypothetical protein